MTSSEVAGFVLNRTKKLKISIDRNESEGNNLSLLSIVSNIKCWHRINLSGNKYPFTFDVMLAYEKNNFSRPMSFVRERLVKEENYELYCRWSFGAYYNIWFLQSSAIKFKDGNKTGSK